MKMDLSSAKHAVAKLTRAQKLMEATRLIQSVLTNNQSPTPSVAAELDRANKEGGPRSRQPLAVVVDTLRRAKRNLDQETPVWKGKKTLEIPAGAQFLASSFTCVAGTRNYQLYIPRQHESEKPALLVMLHGCKQEPVDFAIGTRMNAIAEEHNMFVVYPEQSKSGNPMACWNWFNPKDQVRDFGEPSIIAGITRDVIGQHGIDPKRVFVAGLSAGGAMAAVMAATYPDIYTAMGVHSGLPYKSATDVVSAYAAMRGEVSVPSRTVNIPRTRVIAFHADADPTVHSSNAAKIIETHVQQQDLIERVSFVSNACTCTRTWDHDGKLWGEKWLVHGTCHGWSGGSADGSFVDTNGPDASREMVRFFLQA